MAGKTLSLTFKIDEAGGGFSKLTTGMKGLQDLMRLNVREAEKLKSAWYSAAAATATLTNRKNALIGIKDSIKGLTDATKSFDSAMRAANTMAGKDAAGFERMKGQVTELSKRVPVARDTLANGLYQVISNGVPEDNWISFLEASARSSVGGMADLGQAVNVTSTIIKNYGLEWSAAQDIQDKIQLTAKNGVTSFEQLAAALPRVTGNAATLGVSVNELMATFATLTGVSGNTAEVSTQLAAVFTALVKPSSEATQMAKQMGIQFDAAAIKAAGGMQQFLTDLDASVKAYAQNTGRLEQEIYGKLFGSAESLRALGPLTGELAAKFNENVATMVDGTGSMAQAFDEMSNTVEAKTQKLTNEMDALKESLFGWAVPAQPFIDMGVAALASAADIAILVKSLKGMKIVSVVSTGLVGMRKGLMSLVVATKIYTATNSAATIATHALKVAIRGLLISTGVGAVFAALSFAIDAFSASTEEATDSAGQLEKKTDSLTDVEKTGAEAHSKAEQAINSELKELKGLKDGTAEAYRELDKLNKKYKDYIARQTTVAGMYKALTQISALYCRRLELEAEATVLAAKGAESKAAARAGKARMMRMAKEMPAVRQYVDAVKRGDTELLAQSDATSRRMKELGYTSPVETFQKLSVAVGDARREAAVWADALADVEKELRGVGDKMAAVKTQQISTQDIAKLNPTELKDQIKEIDEAFDVMPGNADGKAVRALASRRAKLQAQLDKLEKRTGKKKAKTKESEKMVADPKSVADYDKNIRLTIQDIHKLSDTEVEAAYERIRGWAKSRDALKLAMEKAQLPKTMDTLDEISAHLAYQNKLYSLGNDEQRKAAAIEIQRLERAKRLKELTAQESTITADPASISTYEQLEAVRSHYQAKMQIAEGEERRQIQQTIDKLNEKEQAMRDADAGLDTSFKGAKSQAEIQAAVSLLEVERAKAKTAKEYYAVQEKINALQRRQTKFAAIDNANSLLDEGDRMAGFSGDRLKRQIGDMGVDGIVSQIHALEDALADLGDDAEPAMRKRIENQIDMYKRWGREAVSTIDTVIAGWNNVKGIGDSIQGITDSLDGSKDAWSAVTGVIDGFIQLYQGIMGIVSIIQMISQFSQGAAVAQTGQAAAGTMSAVSEGALMATEAARAAEAPIVVAANKAVTASVMELAAAQYMAAHASIPFIGFGIASGFVASAKALVTAIGATPFADGGIISGPTLALMGEYSGASHNPEVVAPLDKLRDMIEPRGGTAVVTGELRARGRDLVAVLSNETRISSRGGRHSNIVI